MNNKKKILMGLTALTSVSALTAATILYLESSGAIHLVGKQESDDSKLKKQIEDLKARAETLAKEKAQLENQLKIKEDELKISKGNNTKLRSEIDKLKQDLLDKQGELDKALNEIKAKQAEIDNLKKQIFDDYKPRTANLLINDTGIIGMTTLNGHKAIMKKDGFYELDLKTNSLTRKYKMDLTADARIQVIYQWDGHSIAPTMFIYTKKGLFYLDRQPEQINNHDMTEAVILGTFKTTNGFVSPLYLDKGELYYIKASGAGKFTPTKLKLKIPLQQDWRDLLISGKVDRDGNIYLVEREPGINMYQQTIYKANRHPDMNGYYFDDFKQLLTESKGDIVGIDIDGNNDVYIKRKTELGMLENDKTYRKLADVALTKKSFIKQYKFNILVGSENDGLLILSPSGTLHPALTKTISTRNGGLDFDDHPGDKLLMFNENGIYELDESPKKSPAPNIYKR